MHICDTMNGFIISGSDDLSPVRDKLLLKPTMKYCWLDPYKHISMQLYLKFQSFHSRNKANLRDLIAATGLVISNWIQIVNFSARVTVKIDGWPCKTIGHIFYATSSFVHHFVPIGEFKLELQSRNAQFGSKSTIVLAVWPRNFTDDPQTQKGTSSMLLQALCIIS